MEPSQSSSSLPSVHLPVVQSQATQDGFSQLGGAPAVDMDEKDLFGSSSEEEAAGAAPAAAAPAGSTPVVAAAASAGQPAEEREMFGSDDEDIMDERDLFGTDDEAIDEKDLFGSDDEAGPDAAAAAPQEGRPQPPSRAESVATAEPSEMDEEDIFGRDLSDDEEGTDMKKEVEDVMLRKRPMPNVNRQFAALRMPNLLSVEKKPFNPLKFSEEVRNGCKEETNTQARKTVKLLNPENVIRWRFKKSEEGQLLTSDDGRPQYESNARIVEWEDGTRSLFIGSEAFPLSAMSDEVALFEENTQEVSVCHGFIKMRLVATPRSLDSETHDNIKKAQFTKFEPNSRSMLMNTDDQAYLQHQQELERDLQKEKEKRDKKLLKITGENPMNAAFLESDSDAGDGPSVKRPKLSPKKG